MRADRSLMMGALAASIACGVGCAAATGTRPASDPLGHVIVSTGGARDADTLPLLIALHGRGGNARTFQRFFEGLAAPARVAFLDAPIDEGDGRAWFTFGGGWSGARRQMDDLMPRMDATSAALLARYPTAGKPIVMGFSQGAMLAYMLAVQRPDRYGGAVIVSGGLPSDALPAGLDGRTVPPIVALHGDADEVIPVSADAESVAMLRERGVRASLEVIPGGHHWIDGQLRVRLHAHLVELLGAQAAAAPR